jgi:uncharacterized membrane protein
MPYLRSLALLAAGLLAGAMGYGALNVVQAFRAVPLDVRLTFHTALMRMNGPVIQTVMALAFVTSVAIAVTDRGRPRWLAAAAAALVLVSFLVTRFGNVPINADIKVWAATVPPPDHAAILRRWEIFNVVRTVAAVAAFALLLLPTRR